MIDVDKIQDEYGPEGDAILYLSEAEKLAGNNMLHEAASVINRAYCIDPKNERISHLRNDILDKMSISECGLEFRYIPAGTFLMGSENGDTDESPIHPVFLPAFWISSVPISWEIVCNILGCGKPPDVNFDVLKEDEYWMNAGIMSVCKIILQYCEDETLSAKDWHCHVPPTEEENKLSSMFSPPERKNPDAPYTYKNKPVVALDWNICTKLCYAISAEQSVQHALPTEAEWEKAARGGLGGFKYSWGEGFSDDRVDCNRFSEFSILPSKTFPANGYGLYGMCGGVWDWTQDWYDSKYYPESPRSNPAGSETGKAKVLRGGSWSDCPEACTVSFRMAMPVEENTNKYGGVVSPNVGFRICRRNVT